MREEKLTFEICLYFCHNIQNLFPIFLCFAFPKVEGAASQQIHHPSPAQIRPYVETQVDYSSLLVAFTQFTREFGNKQAQV